MIARHLVLLSFVAAALPLAACERGGSAKSTSAPARNPRAVVAAGGSLIDVRTPEEFAAKHIDGAKNIPVDEVAERMAEVPKDKPVVVYCLSGGRSAAAAKMLGAAGYDVIDIGAMKNW